MGMGLRLRWGGRSCDGIVMLDRFYIYGLSKIGWILGTNNRARAILIKKPQPFCPVPE